MAITITTTIRLAEVVINVVANTTTINCIVNSVVYRLVLTR